MNDTRLYHSVADNIKKLIRNGSFPPGTRLPGERELAERFNVSRVTIREAEIVLQALGFIAIKTGSGAYVLDRTEDIDKSLPSLSAFELTEARSLFEAEAAAMAARAISDEELAKLDQLIEIMSSDDPSDEEASQKADREFHLAIAAASGNAAVLRVVELLWRMRTELPEVRKVHAAICSHENAKDRGTEHTEILQALRERKPSEARSAMKSHFKRLLRSMIDVTEEIALEELRRKAKASRLKYLNSVSFDLSAEQ